MQLERKQLVDEQDPQRQCELDARRVVAVNQSTLSTSVSVATRRHTVADSQSSSSLNDRSNVSDFARTEKSLPSAIHHLMSLLIHGNFATFSLRYCVRREPSFPPLKGHSPQFSANVRCGQTAGRTKMPLGTEAGLGPGNFVFDWDQLLPEKRTHPPQPIFGPRLLWPNGWMDPDATWYRGKPRPRRRCVRWGRSSP